MSHVGIVSEVANLVSEYHEIQNSSLDRIIRLGVVRDLCERLIISPPIELGSYNAPPSVPGHDTSDLLDDDIFQIRKSYKNLVIEIEDLLDLIADDICCLEKLSSRTKLLADRVTGYSRKVFLKNRGARVDKDRELSPLSLDGAVILCKLVCEEMSSDLNVKNILFSILRSKLDDPNYEEYAQILQYVLDKWSKCMVNHNFCNDIRYRASILRLSRST